MPIAGVEEQLRMAELLEDPLYKAWLKKEPRITMPITQEKPWRVWVQKKRGGPWARADFKSYPKAWKFMRQHMKLGIHDCALGARVLFFKPPVVSKVSGGKKAKRYHVPGMPGQNPAHRWCPLCRRPTIWTTFTKHHALPKHYKIAGYVVRCAICGHADGLVIRANQPR